MAYTWVVWPPPLNRRISGWKRSIGQPLSFDQTTPTFAVGHGNCCLLSAEALHGFNSWFGRHTTEHLELQPVLRRLSPAILTTYTKAFSPSLLHILWFALTCFLKCCSKFSADLLARFLNLHQIIQTPTWRCISLRQHYNRKPRFSDSLYSLASLDIIVYIVWNTWCLQWQDCNNKDEESAMSRS